MSEIGREGVGREGVGREELVRINDVPFPWRVPADLEKQPLEGKMKLLSEKGTRDFLKIMSFPERCFIKRPRRKGSTRKKDLLVKIEDARRAILIEALLEDVLRGRAEVSEEEIQRYYKENSPFFIEPQEVKIRHIVVNSEPALKEVVSKLSEGESFEKLASTYNIGKFKDNAGDLGYIREGS